MPIDPLATVQLSVQDRTEAAFATEQPIVYLMSNMADDIGTWPSAARDRDLDKLWKAESMLSGAVFSMAAKIASLDFSLVGPKNAVSAYTNILQSADMGSGWVGFMMKLVTDILTIDNGGFVELMRPPGASALSSAKGIAHLDALKCRRTGDVYHPVEYTDMNGAVHRLSWEQVVPVADMPTPRERYNGYGYCAVSRVLRTAQILRDVGIYKRQKLTGKQPPPALLFVQGIRRGEVTGGIQQAQTEEIYQRGRSIYSGPVVLSGTDPGIPVDAKLIELAGLPDGYDEDTLFKWYIAALAMAFGTDYAEFAPLPGGNLGTASQVETMASRSRGKGPGVIVQSFEYMMNYRVLPHTMTFQFTSTDPAAESERIKLAHDRARERALRVNSEEITAEQALKLAIAEGDAPESFLAERREVAAQEEETEAEIDDTVNRIVKTNDDINDAYRRVGPVI